MHLKQNHNDSQHLNFLNDFDSTSWCLNSKAVVFNRGALINFQGLASPYVLYNMESFTNEYICF